ncbi:MAG: hypothetical protein Q7W56_05710 [Candidatus Latescibacteria bacterium]|nr:hypothetical protein [Candidatus Latescibacterota bacterium]
MRYASWLWCLLLATLPAGCDDDDPAIGDWHPTPPSPAVADWAAQEPFDPLQYTHLLTDNSGCEFFVCAYGEGLDCPSGCFYSRAIGVRCGERIGWLGFIDYHGYVADAGRSYDVLESDATLFDVDTWFDLYDVDRYACLRILLPALARDEQTSRSALLAISALLSTHISVQIGEDLLGNPAVATDREILTILAALPAVNGDLYAAVRARAQELLDGLGEEEASPAH